MRETQTAWTEASGVLGVKESVRGRKQEEDRENYTQRTENLYPSQNICIVK
jgi:hypothetical protein